MSALTRQSNTLAAHQLALLCKVHPRGKREYYSTICLENTDEYRPNLECH